MLELISVNNKNKHKIFTKKAGLIALLLCVSVAMIPLHAEATSSTLEQIRQAEEEKKRTEEEKQENIDERSATQGELNDLQYKQGTLKQKINGLNEELSNAGKALDEIEAKISDKEEEIRIATEELEEAKRVEEEQYEAMKKRVQYMYEQPKDAYLDVLINAGSIADVINYADYILMISDYDSKMLSRLKQAKEEVSLKEAKLEEEKVQLDELKEQNLLEQQRLNELIETTAEYVAEYATKISGVQGELSQIENEIAAQNQLIEQQEENIEALYEQYQRELLLSQQAQAASKRDISEVTFEEGDRYLLANLIYCEAGGEDYAGQLAVGAVVINRVLSSKYPNSVSGVIYQNKQFAPVNDGHLALALAENRATDSCYQAADAAMAGNTNVGNCYYFRTPIEGLSGTSIGGHIFY